MLNSKIANQSSDTQVGYKIVVPGYCTVVRVRSDHVRHSRVTVFGSSTHGYMRAYVWSIQRVATRFVRHYSIFLCVLREYYVYPEGFL